MKQFIIPLIGLSLFLLSGAQTETTHVSAEQEITKLMNDWMKALMFKDTKTLDKLMAPEFTISNVSKRFFDKPETTKESWMNNTENLKVDSIHYIRMKVYVADNVAVVKSTFYFQGSRRYGVSSPDPGKNSPEFTPFIDSTTILVDTWIRRKQGWQVFNRLRVDDPTSK